jgi:hypothetical protein
VELDVEFSGSVFRHTFASEQPYHRLSREQLFRAVSCAGRASSDVFVRPNVVALERYYRKRTVTLFRMRKVGSTQEACDGQYVQKQSLTPHPMPEKQTLKRAQRDAAQGKAPSTQAGEFVREQIHHIRKGKHGARSAKQAIAIGLSEARRSGVKLPPPKGGGEVAQKAQRDLEAGTRRKRSSPKRSQARVKALQKEGRSAASHSALSRQAKQAARKRGPTARSRAAQKAARTRKRVAR